MASRRLEKAAEAIRGVVSMAILAELKDPRVRDVTVTRVEVSADMRYAKVHVSVMGDETQQRLSLRGLQNAAGFLQSKIAERIEIRYTPRLTFLLDQGVKRSIEIARILHEVLPKNASSDEADTPSDEADTPIDEDDASIDEADDSPTASPSDDAGADVTNPSGHDLHE